MEDSYELLGVWYFKDQNQKPKIYFSNLKEKTSPKVLRRSLAQTQPTALSSSKSAAENSSVTITLAHSCSTRPCRRDWRITSE